MAGYSTSYDQDFKTLKQIGEGGYGSVYLVQHSDWGEVVLKKLRDPYTSLDRLELNIEADILKTLRHPNIVTFYEGRFESEFCGLFMEFVEYGSVTSFLKEFFVESDWKFRIIYDIARAMCYLHEQQPPIIHGDLKCQNILIGNDFRAKVCDFGLARIETFSKSHSDHALRGTPAFIAPEYFQNPRKRKTEKYDVYSFAITVWEVFSGKQAHYDFADARFIPVQVQNKVRPMMGEINGAINEVLDKLIRDCWNQEPEKRPTFVTIKECLQIEIKIKKRNQGLKTALQKLMDQAKSKSALSRTEPRLETGTPISKSDMYFLIDGLPSRKTGSIKINNSCTIDELIAQVNRKYLGIGDDDFCLLYNGEILQFGRHLHDYRIPSGTQQFLYLCIKHRGGGRCGPGCGTGCGCVQ